MSRRLLLASAISSLTVFAPAAFAQTEVTDEVTDPIATSTAGSGGAADDIHITLTGRVVVSTTTTPAVTLDSDNTILQEGNVSIITDDDGGVGIHVVGGNTGTLTNSGLVQVQSDSRPTDLDGDGDLDGPAAIGGNRIAILVDGAAVFTGDIILTTRSAITVLGNDSSGIRVLTGIDGSLDLDGTIGIIGDRSEGVAIQSDVSDDIFVRGQVTAVGDGTVGVSVEGDVGGTIAIAGTIAASGYQFSGQPNAEYLAILDADDLNQGGSAFYLSGSVAEGVLVDGPTTTAAGISNAQISVRGSAPAMSIEATAASGDIVLGEVVIAAVVDDPDTADDETQAEQFLGYSLVNRGTLAASGELEAINATALRIGGSGGFSATLSDGMLNDGAISATSNGANATSVLVASGAVIPVLTNVGDLRATSIGAGGIARSIDIESGGSLFSLNNDLIIFSQALLGGSAYAIRDQSNTLASITNTHVISALGTAPLDGVALPTSETVAIDLSASTIDTTYHQYRPTDADADSRIETLGDIRFGSGNDTLRVEAGGVTGAVSFGLGADQLILSGGSRLAGELTDTDGDLNIQVDDATLQLASTAPTNVSEARFGDGSRLLFEIDHDAGIAASLNASGTITFETGSAISTSLTNLIGDGATYVVLTSSALVIQDSIAALQDTIAPFLYESSIALDPSDSNSLILTLRRRSAAELGMSANQGEAYTAAYAGWQSNAELGAAIASLTTESDFYQAYNQLLPEYASSALQFSQASNDSAIGALANRLEAVRRSPEQSGGLWIQEFSYFADRAGTDVAAGYRGQGIGLAVGADRPFGPFYAAGVNFVGSASEISESDGVDDPMSAISAQIGVYAGAEMGGMSLDLYGGIGYDSFEHNRRVLIGTFDATPTGEWSGYHTAASARLGRQFSTGRYFFTPSLSVDYLSLFESAYTETGGGDGIDLVIDDRESSSFTSTALFTMGARFERVDSWWAPSLRIGYRNEFSSEELETLAHFDGYNETFTLRSEAMPGSGFIFGFGVGAGSGYSTFSLDYDADIRDNFIRHTARLVIRMVF
ncbi:MAG: autotransporter outer membrane beta-barrel domain-containing protein [Maricaulis sp.]|nr:autotransporter outer membrane beta-barrel domain-containing protein [Maricaulis sp.]